MKYACCGSALPIWKHPCPFRSFRSIKSHLGLLMLSLRWWQVKLPTDCIHHLLNESRRAKVAAWRMAPECTAPWSPIPLPSPQSRTLYLLFSHGPWSIISPLREAQQTEPLMARCHMIKARHAGGINPLRRLFSDCLVRPARPNLTTPSLPSPLFSLLFNYPWLSLFLFVPFRKKEEKGVVERKKKEAKMEKWIADCHVVFKSLLRPPLSRWEMW